MAAPTLPQEIIDKVIGGLSRHNDMDTLQKCSIVSSSFREPSQKKIFRILTIFTPRRALESDRYEFFRANTRICTFVESVVLMMDGWERDTESTCCPPPETLLPELPRMRRLDIISTDAAAVQWASGPDDLKREVLNLLQSSLLQSLNFTNIRDFPIQALQWCPQLQFLGAFTSSFHANLDFASIPLTPPPPAATRGPLCSLRVHDSIVVQHFKNPSPLLSLLGVQYYITKITNKDSYTDCQEMLRLRPSALRLEVLTLDALELKTSYLGLSATQYLDLYLDLGRLRNLRTLTVTHTRGLSLNHILHTLESIPTPNKLRKVVIRGTDQMQSRVYRRDDPAWRSIDDLLRSEGYATSFKGLYIKGFTWPSNDILMEYFKHATPKLSLARRLYVKTSAGWNLVMAVKKTET